MKPSLPNPEKSTRETAKTVSVSEAESAEHQENLRRQVAKKCREIPKGRVQSYGGLGKQLETPISGYICGRIMGTLMDDVPWWRVVAKDGRLPISKRSPTQAIRQRELLRSEGVEFDENGDVKREFFVD